MKYFNVILLYICIVAISFATGQSTTLTAGPVTCNYKKKDLDDSYNINTDAFVLCNGSHCDILGSGVVIFEDILTILKKGTYIFQGKFDGQLFIDVAKEDFVHIVLNNMTIKSTSGPAIYAVLAEKVTITLNGNNSLTDSTIYTLDGEGEPDATLFVDADLSINGSGSLVVVGNFSDAIRCKKDLKIISGNIIVPLAKKRGIKARNSLCIKDGVIDIISDDTSLKVTKDNDPEKGYIVIDGGQITILSGYKGIHSETHLTINDGYIDIKKSKEGLESQMVDILGGEIHIIASDDGINASKIIDKSQPNYWYGTLGGGVYINIVGGKTYITVPGGDVDGIDANGNLYIGGNAELYASNGYGSIYGNMAVLDADGTNAICANATVIATGGYGGRYKRSLEKRQRSGNVPPPPPGGFGRETHGVYQPYIQGSIPAQKAGTKLTVLDVDENVIATYTPSVTFASILVTSPKMIAGEEYIVSAGGNRQLFIATAGTSGDVPKSPSVTAKPEVTTTTTTTTTATTTTVFVPPPKAITTTVTTTTTAFTNSTATVPITITNITEEIEPTTIIDTTSGTVTTSTKSVPNTTSLKTITTIDNTSKTIDSTMIDEITTSVDVTTTIESTSFATPTTESTEIDPIVTSTTVAEPSEPTNISTQEVIATETSVENPTETSVIETPTNPASVNVSCSAAILELGYKCCAPDCRIAYSDASGDWGYEKGTWCGCGDRKPNSSKCSKSILDHGYSCCSDSCKVTHVDQYGSWGFENGKWCGCAMINTPAKCPTAMTDKGFKCCQSNNCIVVEEDGDGKWGYEDDWCGISLDC